MKLVSKTNKYYLIFFVVLFPLMISVDYYLINYVVNNEVDEILLNESKRIIFNLEENGELPNTSYFFEMKPIKKDVPEANKYADTLIYEAYTDKLIPYRTYKFTALVHSQKVVISLRHVLLEMNELIAWLFVTTTVIILLLVIGLFLINQGIYKWTWKPFFKNLSKLTNYDITKKDPIHLENSDISEFEELSGIVTTLMNRVRKDFQNLKEFNENISHEIQTPLAIIRNKMVLLLESQNLNDKESQWVETVYQEANKLSKIGKSLTLISRIENQEFTSLDSLDLRSIVENIVSNMEEIINFKNLKMDLKLSTVKVKCDLILANILFTNLIKNAVQHNHDGGYIVMKLEDDKFEIINSGDASEIETAQLFSRFKRGNTGEESLGLGLAITQRICELYGFKLDYEYREGRHKLSLYFNS